MRFYLFYIFLILFSLFSCKNPKENNKSLEFVNVYSKRHYQVDKDLFKKFEEEFGIKVNVVKASADELIERIITEGENCPADLIFTVDAGKLYKAAEKKLLQKINSTEICPNIKKSLIDKNELWLPVTYRSRVVVYSNDRVDKSELSTYDDLANDKWRNRILVRPSSNAYNQALLSSIVAHQGNEYALNWCNKLVKNFARDPKGNDRDQVRAIAASVGDIAIVNSYYIGLLKNSSDSLDREVANSVSVFFPNQGENERGAHINISGIGLLKNSPNLTNAKKLMKFLTSEYAQNYYSTKSYEYPVNNLVKLTGTIADWGDFKIDSLDLNLLGSFRKQAVEIFEKSSWK